MDLAEVATPGALIATDEEGGLTIFPAFEDVRAAGLLADRVQALALHQAGQGGVFGPHPGRGPDPRRLAFDRGLGIARFHAKQPSAFRCERHLYSSISRTVDPAQTCRRWAR